VERAQRRGLARLLEEERARAAGELAGLEQLLVEDCEQQRILEVLNGAKLRAEWAGSQASAVYNANLYQRSLASPVIGSVMPSFAPPPMVVATTIPPTTTVLHHPPPGAPMGAPLALAEPLGYPLVAPAEWTVMHLAAPSASREQSQQRSHANANFANANGGYASPHGGARSASPVPSRVEKPLSLSSSFVASSMSPSFVATRMAELELSTSTLEASSPPQTRPPLAPGRILSGNTAPPCLNGLGSKVYRLRWATPAESQSAHTQPSTQNNTSSPQPRRTGLPRAPSPTNVSPARPIRGAEATYHLLPSSGSRQPPSNGIAALSSTLSKAASTIAS